MPICRLPSSSTIGTSVARSILACFSVTQRAMMPCPRHSLSQARRRRLQSSILELNRPGAIFPGIAGDSLDEPPAVGPRSLDNQQNSRNLILFIALPASEDSEPDAFWILTFNIPSKRPQKHLTKKDNILT